MSMRVYSKKELLKRFKGKRPRAHVECSEGERLYTSYAFVCRNDRRPKDNEQNFIHKILAKEKRDGNIEVVRVWEYPNRRFGNKYNPFTLSKAQYEEFIESVKEHHSKNLRCHCEVIYPQLLTGEVGSDDKMYG